MQLGGRLWTCVVAGLSGDSFVEQWCPRGQMPSRADMLLSRTRWNGPLGGSPTDFVSVNAQIVAERAFVRPALQVVPMSERMAVGVIALRDDVLMGDSWQIQLAHDGGAMSTTCTLEIWSALPDELDPAFIQILIDLVSAPDGVPVSNDSPALQDVQAAIAAASQTVFSEPVEPALETLDAIAQAAESLPPSVDANVCLAQLATWLAGVAGAPFLGLSAESVRLHRILLRRIRRETQPTLWAFSVRGALLALADQASVREIAALIAACTAAIAKPPLDQMEREILHHCEAELRLRADAALRESADGLLLSPFRRGTGISVLILRPLVTAHAPSVPNRFVNLLQHAWRFRDEPTTMTFEETLSRALGHRCSFISRGGEFEKFGIGRTSSTSPDWQSAVEVMVADAILSQIVIVYPSDSPGMQWELDLLAARPVAEQTRLFVIPPDIDPDAAQKQWEAARRALASRNLAIPDWHPDGLIFTYDANGALAWTETFDMLWEGRLASQLAP